MHWGTEISIHTKSLKENGLRFPWFHHGWSRFAVPPLRCQWPRSQCFQQPMPFFVGFKMISRWSFVVRWRLYPGWSKRAFLTCTRSSVIITTSLMNPHSILGPHVSDYTAALYINCVTGVFQCSIHGSPMKAWSSTTKTICNLLNISSFQRKICTLTTSLIMPINILHHLR